jgi:hypothetical protein
MNILEQEDIIKGLPDQALMQEAQMPSGQVPQYLVVSEIQRRSDMRKRYKSGQEQVPQGTVKDKVMQEGIMASMPPQMAMAPQMAQRMPNMPPPQMPPQGIEQVMPPQMMAEGGIVQMQNGGQSPSDSTSRLRSILTSNPGITFADLMSMGFTQADLDRLSNLGYQERMDTARILGDAKAGLERVDPEMRLSKTIPTKVRPASDIYSQSAVTGFADNLSQGAQDFVGNFAFDSAMNMPNYQLLAKDIGIPELSTAPQRGAGGRPFDAGGFSDVMPDLGMPTREQRIAADRARVENIRSGLGDSVTAQDVDDAVAGMVTERAPRSGGFGGIADALGNMFDFGLSERYAERYPEAVAANERTKSNIADFLDRSPQMDRYQSMMDLRQNPGMLDYETNFESKHMSDFDAIVSGDYPAGSSGTLADTYGISRGDASVQGKSDVQTQGTGISANLLANPTQEMLSRLDAPSLSPVEFDKDLGLAKGKPDAETALVDAVASQPGNDKSNSANNPALDFADLIADSRRQAMSNALIQLGAGIAGGDVSKGIAAAGQAATAGTQDARDLDMKRRLAEYEAGREDLRREAEDKQFDRRMSLEESKQNVLESQFGQKFAEETRQFNARLSQDYNEQDALDFRARLNSIPDMIDTIDTELMRLQNLGEDESNPRIAQLIKDRNSLYNTYAELNKQPRGRNRFEGYSVESTSP